MALTETEAWRPDLHVLPAPEVWDIYARQSIDHAVGIEGQIEFCTREIERMGGRVGRVYADNEQTADTKKRRYARPGYKRLLADIKSGACRAVIAQDQDRLLRDIREGEDLIELVEATGCRITTIRGGEQDLTKTDHRTNLRLKAVLARQELEKKSERQRDGARRDADSGRFYAPRRAFGYHTDGSINEPEAAVVRDAFDRVQRGESLPRIAEAMNTAGLPTVRGNRWQRSGVRAMLLNPRYAGWRVYRPGDDKHEIRRRGLWQPIIDEDTWLRVEALLTDPERRTTGDHPGGTARKYLGSGLYVCQCGLPVKIANRGRGAETRAYNCPKWHVSRAAGKVDLIVLTAITGWLTEHGADLLAVANPEMGEARAEARRLEDELAERRRWLDQGKIDPDDFLPMKRRIEADLTVVRRKITMAARGSVLARIANSADPAQTFSDADLSVKREVIDAVMVVELHPSPRRYAGQQNGARFDEETVRLRWR